MTIFGNICLCLAAGLYFVPLQKVLHTTPNLNGTYAGVGILFSVVLAIVPLWLCLSAALFAVTARGGFDWLLSARFAQFLVVILASVTVMIATGFSLLGKFVTAPELPPATRWLQLWAAHVFPVVLMLFCLVSLNPRLAPWLPPLVVRLPLIIVTLISLLVCGGLLAQKLSGRSPAESQRQNQSAETNEK
jgi:hypothetical protein